jgi:hypothetical protein
MSLVEEVVETVGEVGEFLDYLFLGAPSQRSVEALRVLKQEMLEAATNVGWEATREAIQRRPQLVDGEETRPAQLPRIAATRVKRA